MKDTRFKCILTAVLATLFLNACTEPVLKNPNPSATILPTSAATATLTPVPAPTLLGEYELLSPEDMRYDLDELFHRVETTHPNPYAKRPKAEVDREQQQIYEELSQPMTIIEFYRILTPLINSLGDSHTTVSLPDDKVLPILQDEIFFPFDLQMENGHTYVVSSYSDYTEVKLGTEFLEVNGMPVSIIQEEANRYFPPGRYINWPEFWLLFGSLPEYQIKLLPQDKNEAITIEIPAITFDALEQGEFSTLRKHTAEALTYTHFQDESAGLLAINNFTGIAQLVEPAFVEIQKDNIEHLVIDIRSNQGGDSKQADMVMNYLTDQPYRFCSRSYLAPIGGDLPAGPREQNCDFRKPFNTRYPFRGKLYLLIGPDTYSNGIGFATILQDHGLATLVGEATDDTASSCGGITIPGLSLPRTGLIYYLSTVCFVRPSGDLNDQGVIPDVIVKTTIQDRLAGQDPVLQSTLEIIRNSGKTP